MLGGGKQISEILKLPAICSSASFPYRGEEMKKKYSKSKKFTFKFNLKDWVFALRYSIITGRFERKYKVKYPRLLEVLFNKGDANIVFTSRMFQPDSNYFDESYKFVGPSLNDRAEDRYFPFEDIAGEKIIYISTGTVFDLPEDFYRNCFNAFKDMDRIFIVSVRKDFDISRLGDIPDNFIVKNCNYIPQLEVLKRAELFINTGGMNSVSECLYYNVPMIVIPVAADSPIVGDRVQELGAGICLDKSNLTVENLKEAVGKVLSNDNYKIKCKEIGDSFKLSGGYKKAADCISEFKKTKELRRLGSVNSI